jgi:hypothetical protein
MTVPVWPFARVQPSGFADGVDVPSAAQLNLLDEQLSRAANGLLWSDVALVKNFSAGFAAANVSRAIVYDPVAKLWLAVGANGTPAPKGYASLDSGVTWSAITSFGSFANMTPLCAAAALDTGVGAVSAFGAKLVSAALGKIFYSTDGWATHSASGLIGGSDTVGCSALMYSTRLGMWIAGLDNGEIWTASRIGNGWTLRKAADARSKTGFAESGTRIVAVDALGDRTHTSTDGITWTTSASFAGASGSSSICYLPQPGTFVIVSASGAGTGSVLVGTNGTTWTQNPTAGTSFLSAAQTVQAYGRMLVLGGQGTGALAGIYYSLDVGNTWKLSPSIQSADSLRIQLGEDQFIVQSGGSALYRGICGGL